MFFLVVGLGNPGKQYQFTRHNLGFMVADLLAKQASLSWSQKRQFHGKTAQGNLVGKRVMLLKPTTYMNLSGSAARAASDFLKIPKDQILAIHDDLDLDFGRIQVRCGGGHGGHRGLQSMIASLENADFNRVRLGVGRPPKGVDGADYVLEKFRSEEQATLTGIIERAAQAVEVWLQEGLTVAMNRFNPWSESKPEGVEVER